VTGLRLERLSLNQATVQHLGVADAVALCAQVREFGRDAPMAFGRHVELPARQFGRSVFVVVDHRSTL